MTERTAKQPSPEELEYHFNPRVSVPEYPELANQRAEESRRARAALRSFVDVPYGETARQVMDIFPCGRVHAPVLIYIHGGYWRSGRKEDNCAFVPAFVARGASVAVIEYDLCPAVTVTEIVRQTRRAIAWVYRNIAAYGGDPRKIYLSGHSAGGHLTAMALAYDWEQQEGLPRDLIKGAVPTSGVYDLEVVMRISVQEQVRLTPESARENSPFLHPLVVNCPVLVAVGGAEPEGWRRMSRDYFELCRDRGLPSEYLVVPGANHYTLADHLAGVESALARVVFKMMGI